MIFPNKARESLPPCSLAGALWGSDNLNKENRGGHNKKTHEEFVKEVKDQAGQEFSVLGKYETAHTKVLMQHNKCGYEWKIRPDNFLGGQRCPRCGNSGGQKKTQEKFEREISEIDNGEYTVLGKYRGRGTRVLVQHKKCGLKYKISPKHFLYDGLNKCPDCNNITSSGEKKIKNYLDKNDMDYKREYTFPDCRNNKKLRFDFALFNKIGELRRLIEYQGKQHYQPRKPFGGKKGFYLQSKRDKIKFNYCRDNNIPFLTIPHTKYNDLEAILPQTI